MLEGQALFDLPSFAWASQVHPLHKTFSDSLLPWSWSTLSVGHCCVSWYHNSLFMALGLYHLLPSVEPFWTMGASNSSLYPAAEPRADTQWIFAKWLSKIWMETEEGIKMTQKEQG